MIQIPASPGQMILDDVAVRMRPLLMRDEFVRFCKDRNLTVSREQLHRFEELRVLAPVIRIASRAHEDIVLHLDGTATASDFDSGWVTDASAPRATYTLPSVDDQESMAFYSAFQIWTLERVLRETTWSFHMEEYAEADAEAVDWNDRFQRLRSRASASILRLRSDPLLRALPILCQVISNRYLPYALGRHSTIRVGATSHWGQWMQFSSHSWDWSDYCSDWDPAALIPAFELDEESLERAYHVIVIAMYNCDPLWAWGELVQFINQEKRDKLRGDALRAEFYRQSADMVRRLHLDLYGVDLGPPQDTFGHRINHIPELAVRPDAREYLQYVVNQYDLNPQPKAVLFVEGATEVVFVEAIFRQLFGAHHGTSGIELKNLGGVDNATGRKREDRYNAIFRLVDYLHDHQTIAFIMLDREGRAQRLKNDAYRKASLFGARSRAMPPRRIRVWKRNFELDNFSDTEIARALTSVAGEGVRFRSTDIKAVRSQWPKGGISELFRDRTGRDLDKPVLAERLVEIVVAPETRRRPANRPVVKFLQRVHREALRNPFPLTQDVWRRNQRYLDR